MSRRNLHLLFLVTLVSLACYARVGSAQRSHYGRVLLDTMSEIQQKYLESVGDRELFEAAVAGMASSLDDYSAYIAPKSYGDFKESIDRRFGGIGIQVVLDKDTKQLTVLSPLVGTPAYEAGVLAGDKIMTIDGESTEGFSLEDAVERMRGEPGEPVTIEVLHLDGTEPIELRIVRDVIKVATVLGDTRAADGSWNFFLADQPGIGYIRLVAFSEETASEIKAALDWLSERNAQGLILDLRNNPGGLLHSAIDVCDLFLDEGLIVSTRGRDQMELESFHAQPGNALPNVPLVVLVNRYSASASEIVAACLQDHGRATIVGDRTWGKGSVQNVIPLEGDRSALKLTVASYWRPNGHNIHRTRNATDEEEWGVMPDDGYLVSMDDKMLADVMRARRDRDIVRLNGQEVVALSEISDDETEAESTSESSVDAQLEKAIEHIRDEIDRQHAAAQAA